jgi:PPOX class probable F420-dependent enzyme
VWLLVEPIDIVAGSNKGVLTTVKRDGHPQLSNIFYLWDAEERVARITTTADRVKARVLSRNPAAALYVSGAHFYQWAVAEGDAEVSPPTTEPGDAVAQELLPLYESFMGQQDRDALYQRLIEEKRLVIRLRVTRVYGMALEQDPSA